MDASKTIKTALNTNKKGFVLSILALTLIAVIAMYGTLAYFTDTDSVTNTFVMGEIDIDFHEPGWSEDDGLNLFPGIVRVKDPTVLAVEGASYMRVRMEIVDGDGTLITDTGRIDLILSTLYYDKAYGTANLNIETGEKYSEAELQQLLTDGAIDQGFNRARFGFGGAQTGKPAIRYYNYIANNGVFDAGGPSADKAVLFSNVVIPRDWSNVEIYELNGDEYTVSPEGVMEVTVHGTGYSIILTAEAIQAANIANADEAFAALDSTAGVTRGG
jgi:predicted ribosomally synthesized peptide with SipW-like signal peptide